MSSLKHDGKKGSRVRGYLGLDLVCVALGQLLLAGSRDEDVTVRLEDASFIRRRVREADDGPVGLETKTKV